MNVRPIPLVLVLTFSTWLLPASAAALAAGAGSKLPDKIEFNRDIRPILSDNCYACHGPDKNKRKADLRLDTKDGSARQGGAHRRRRCPQAGRERALAASLFQGRRPHAAGSVRQGAFRYRSKAAPPLDRAGSKMGGALGLFADRPPATAGVKPGCDAQKRRRPLHFARASTSTGSHRRPRRIA